MNSVGRPNTIVTEASLSADVNVPDGSVMSLTAINAFVDGMSFTSFSLFSRIEEISVILSVVS